MHPIEQVLGPAVSLERGMLSRERRAERKASSDLDAQSTAQTHAGLCQAFLLGH